MDNKTLQKANNILHLIEKTKATIVEIKKSNMVTFAHYNSRIQSHSIVIGGKYNKHLNEDYETFKNAAIQFFENELSKMQKEFNEL